jgi:hypothetical protein
MTFRERFVNTLRGEPVDRPPFVELGPAPYLLVRLYSDWNDHMPPGRDPRKTFGFDNVNAGKGYAAVPLDPFAVPRIPERPLAANDGYERRFIPQWGCVAKHVHVDEGSPFSGRVLEDHAVSSPDDWRRVRDAHFPLSTEGRFPEDWSDWCNQNRESDVPIALQIPEPEDGVWNLLGEDGDGGLLMSLRNRPEFVSEIAGHLSELYLLCVEKALSQAPIDMVIVSGSDLWPLAGPRAMEQHFMPFYERVVGVARESGIDLICLSTRVLMNLEWIERFMQAGVNGVRIVEMTGESHMVRDVIDRYGDTLFYIGNMDVRVLRRDRAAIATEVERGMTEAQSLRIIPCLASDHILPDVPYENYHHYVGCLRKAVFRP